MADDPDTRLDKVTQAARAPETGDDSARFGERPGKLVKHKPVEKTE